MKLVVAVPFGLTGALDVHSVAEDGVMADTMVLSLAH